MEWSQFIILVIAFVGLFTWNRSESRADVRHMDTLINSNRELVRAIQEDNKAFQQALMAESKDFHGRLCAIEERNKGGK